MCFVESNLEGDRQAGSGCLEANTSKTRERRGAYYSPEKGGKTTEIERERGPIALDAMRLVGNKEQ